MLKENNIDINLSDDISDEDFAEIDALLEKWSHEECEAPDELHQSIMGALSSVSPENIKSSQAVITPIKKKSNAIRYLAVAALAAGVLLASMAVDKISLDGNNGEESINSRIAVSSHHADEMDDSVATASYNSAAMPQMLNDEDLISEQAMNKNMSAEIDWQQEKNEKQQALAIIEEQLATVGLNAQEKADLEREKAWLEDCLEAINNQDSAYYSELLLNSPLSE